MTSNALLPATRKFIQELEELSGYPVSFFEDPSLKLLATIRTGTPNNPIHVIRYRPGETAPDYRIAFEVGFALRMFARPPAERFHLGSNKELRKQVSLDVLQMMPSLGKDRATEMGTYLFDGLMRQLRSCPVGMLVDLQLYQGCPELHELQRSSLLAQAQENVQSLSAELARNYPKKIVYGNRAMNAAHALFVADLVDQPHLAIPYRAAGLEAIGTQLLSRVTARPYDQIDDKELILDWSRQLDIASWVEFLPFT